MSQNAVDNNIIDLVRRDLTDSWNKNPLRDIRSKNTSLIHREAEYWGYLEKTPLSACPVHILFPGDPLLGTFGDPCWGKWTFGLPRMAAFCN